MKIKWHYSCTASPELLNLLKQHAVPSEITPAYQDELLSIPAHLTFDLFEDDSFFSDIRAQLPEDAVSTPDLCFSDAELQEAQWLTVRGTNLRLEIANSSMRISWRTDCVSSIFEPDSASNASPTPPVAYASCSRNAAFSSAPFADGKTPVGKLRMQTVTR